jgi:pentatricopeptide repeat protein
VKWGFAQIVFDEMGERELVSWNSMISGRWVEGFVLEKKVEVNSYVGSALIDMYGKCRDLISARRVFDSMPNKDVVTWNAIITG